MSKREQIQKLAAEKGWQLHPVADGESTANTDLFGYAKGTWIRVRYSRGGSVVGGKAMDRPTMPWAQDLWGKDKAGQAMAFLDKFTHPRDYRVDHQEEWYE